MTMSWRRVHSTTCVAVCLACVVSARGGSARSGAPTIVNPGPQTSPLSDRYGYAEAVLAANPAGYWRLDDSGVIVSDWAMTPHPATAVGGVTVAQPGALADGSTAMALDGLAGTYIDIPNTSALDVATAVTVEAWVKGSLTAPAAILERTTAAGVAYRLAYDSGHWIFHVESPSMSQQAVAAIASSDIDAWVYVAGTYDGKTIRLYKNGVEVAAQAQGGAMRTGTGGAARLGGASDGSNGFAGMLDEAAIYPRALSAAQIGSHYALRTATSLVSLQIVATDPSTDFFTYSATGLPAGLEIHPATGLITGNPSVPGTSTVTVTVRAPRGPSCPDAHHGCNVHGMSDRAPDPPGLSSSESFTWTITTTLAPNPHRPSVATPASQTSLLTDRYGYAEAVLAANPIGYWRMDDAGTALSDWAVMPHPATAIGGVTVAQPGALADGSTAMELDGQAGTYIDIPNASALDSATAVTVEAWVKGSLTTPAAVVERTTAGGLAYRLAYAVGQWLFRVEGASMAQQAVAPIADGDSNTWLHLVGTYDGSTIRLFKNGLEIGRSAQTGTLRTGTGGTARIGSLSGASTGYAGDVDEVAIYPRALSAAQIASHYALRGAPSLVSLPLAASDPEDDVLTYSASGLPPGLEIQPATGVIIGNPFAAGTYTATVTATDPIGLSSSGSFSWMISTTLAANPHRPSVANPGAQTSSLTDRYGYAEAVLAANPVGYWRLDDAGPALSDWASAPHRATAVGGVIAAQPGALGDGSTAMQLDGDANSYIEVPDTSALDVPNAVTVEAWVNGALAGSAAIVERTTATGLAYRLSYAGGQWLFRIEGPSTAQEVSAPIANADVNTWLYLAGTYDGTTLRLYRNGAEIGNSALMTPLRTGTGGITRFGGPAGASSGFAGLLDEVAVYPTALTAPQLASHYALRTAASLVSLQIAATDPDNDTLSYNATGLPNGLEIHPETGTITGDPSAPGTYTVVVTATDPIGLSGSESFSWTISTTLAPNPHVPVLTNPGNQSNPVMPAGSNSVSVAVSATDPDGDALTYSASGLPSGLVLNPATGVISGDPLAVGVYSVIVSVTDPTGLTDAKSFTWTTATPCTYAVSPLELTVPASGQTGSLTVTAAASCAWSGTPQVPWMTLTPPTGIASGNVRYTIDENISPSPRTTTLVLAGQPVQVTQAAGVERTGPVTITARVSPPPNAAGWNNTAVTVFFTCANANSCSSPVTVTTEGVGQIVSGFVSNGDHSATTSVTLNIDRTPPTVALSVPLPEPANGALDLAGIAGDGLSGVASTTCNGAPASFNGMSAACSVPVSYGVNTIVMQAVDAAGNSSSAATALAVPGTPSFLTISPNRRTLLIGQTVVLEPRDDGGFVAPNPIWSSDNTAVASVAPDGTLTAYGAGHAVVTATSGTLSTTVTVDVVAGTSLSTGASVWSVATTAGYEPTDTVAVRTSVGTAYAKVESRWDATAGEWGAYTDATIQGLTSFGEKVYTTHLNLAFGEHPLRAMGDSEGGVIMPVQKEATSSAERTFYRRNGGGPVSLVRIATSASGGWRQPLGFASRLSLQSLTIGAENTIYGIRSTVDSLPGGGDQVFGLDVLTGRTKFQIALPTSIARYRSVECPQLDYDTLPLAKLSTIKVDHGGWATFIVTTQVFVQRLSVYPGTCNISNISMTERTVNVWLYRVSPQGAVQALPVSEYASDPSADVGYATTLPADDGGVFASWGRCTYAGHPNTPLCSRRARYLGPDGLGAEYAVADPILGHVPYPPTISAAGRVGYGPSGAIDLATGAHLWSIAGSFALPSAALDGGSVLYSTYGTATVYGPDGAVVSSGSSPFYSYDATGTVSYAPLIIEGALQVGSTIAGDFAEVVTSEAYVDDLSAFPVSWGSQQKTGAQPNCEPPPLFASSPLSTPRDYYFTFDDEFPKFPDAGRYGTFAEDIKKLFLPQFEMWRFGGDRGFPLGKAITRLTSKTDTANLVIQIGALKTATDALGRPFKAAGLTLFPTSVVDATSAVRDRIAGGVPGFLLEEFGIIVDPDAAAPPNEARVNYLKYVAVHEFGHVIGLSHPLEGCSWKTSVMAYPAGLTLHAVAPTDNDKAALRKFLKIQ